MQRDILDALAAEVEAFRDSAAHLLSRERSHERIRALRYTAEGFERSAWSRISEAGWPAVLVPEEDGGLGLRLDHAAAVLEEVGMALLPEPILTSAMLVPVLLARLPKKSQGARRDTLLRNVVGGMLILGLAWDEGNGLADHSDTTATVVRRDDSALVLDGAKRWVVPGVGADGWLVTAMLDGEFALLHVVANTAGLSCEPQPRVDGSPMAAISFDGVRLEADALLATGDTALQAMTHALDVARLLQAAELLGVARRAFTDTRQYLKTRVQFGKPIGSNQSLQHRMVDASIQVELAGAALAEMLAQVHRNPASLAMAASRCKARCAEAALQVTRLAIQFHGAMGYTDECAVGLYAKRAMQLASWLGNAHHHRERYLALQPLPQATALDEGVAEPTEFPHDADWDAMPEAQFRAMVRGFFRSHYPSELRDVPRRLHWNEIGHWYLTLSSQGWIAPSWPREHGGMALPLDKLIAFVEEQEAYGVARMPDQGLINLGPLLISYGSEEQKAWWLPRIISGEHIWCQGYSEPNAGSDLASLRTEAVEDGDDFIVSGQKIWTTLAMDATHIFLLVRTGRFEKRQEGISFLLCDLSSAGITVRAIPNIAGEEEFCEVFLDNVRVPKANLVGKLHKGWQLAKSLLGHERIFVGSPKSPQYALGRLQRLAHVSGLAQEPAFCARYAQLHLDVADLRSLYGRFADIVKRGEELPPDVSMLKVWATETYTRIGVELMEAAGPEGGALGMVDIGGEPLAPLGPLFNAMVTTIYGGTNEIQRNILARQMLDLPN